MVQHIFSQEKPVGDLELVISLAGDVTNGQVPFPMRTCVFEEGKQSHKTGAMRLMHAPVPFMSADVTLPQRQRRMMYASNESSGSTGY